uniref:Iron-binding zinc finger CDGSH type domain-containing protein n=1 Tax=Minutocellus polymorphus TaxID=265543 RepID=A0A7S0ASB7_9STRA|mmetsp:Transcript_3120/g.5332  ORF Transcript_3120/g.5332 Transcript_3120/m.5332 type:complete len:104 (+) Transcript_3120:173-484(+)
MDVLFSLDPLSITVGIGIGAILSILLAGGNGSGQINPSIMKSDPKVVNICSLKDIEDSVLKSDKGVVAYCRCWRSKTFPYCDGSHVKHNKSTGDNTGPLVIKT